MHYHASKTYRGVEVNSRGRWSWIGSFTVALFAWEETPVNFKQENWWVSEQFWGFWRRKNSRAFAENENAISRSSSRLPYYYSAFFLAKEWSNVSGILSLQHKGWQQHNGWQQNSDFLHTFLQFTNPNFQESFPFFLKKYSIRLSQSLGVTNRKWMHLGKSNKHTHSLSVALNF